MTFRFRRVLVMAAGLAFAVTFTEAQAPAAPPAPAAPTASAAAPAAASAPGSEFPAGPGRDTFIRVCSSCHAPEQVIGHGQDASGWADTINQMIQNGAQGSDQDFGDIVQYLSTYVGPMPAKIDVNTVTSLGLQNWLGFTAQQGDAVVAYRTAHGKFTSPADLEKVPNVTPGLINNIKGVLTF